MPRIHMVVQDIDDLEAQEEQDDWEQLIGTRSADERRAMQFGSLEMRDKRRNARGSREALDRRRSDRRKTVHRGGKR